MRCRAKQGFTTACCLAVWVSFLSAAFAPPSASAAEKVTVGTVGQASANLWPVLIALDKGYFAEEGVDAQLVFVPSSAALVQQITAQSLDICMSTGVVDPIRAVGMGAPIAIARIEVQAPPYALVSKPAIKSMAELKGKLISLGGAKDITRIYVERMLEPNGVKPGEFDMVFAGATTARAQALISGAVDAAILLPPFNFHATDQGFNQLGLTIDYIKDLPFSGIVVNVNWANAHKELVAKLLRAHAKGTAFFEDSGNREEALRILQTASGLTREDVERGYTFLHDGHYFDTTGKVSKSKLAAVAKAMESLGDLPGALDINKVVLPGVTQVTD
jgi:NitT/TauT family transport system substrate-binding protein